MQADLEWLMQSLCDEVERELNSVELDLLGGRKLTVEEARLREKMQNFLTNARQLLNTIVYTEWIWETGRIDYAGRPMKMLRASPVYGRLFCHDLIWKRAERFIVSSATILDPKLFVRETGLDLSFKPDEIRHIQVPSIFPPEIRPIIDLAEGKLSLELQEINLPKAIAKLEKILAEEKGSVAVHFPSYRLARQVYERISPVLRQRIILPKPETRDKDLKRWLESRGKVLFAVAFQEGQDWKYDLCEAQVLFKALVPDVSDKRVAARLRRNDFKWLMIQALKESLQAYGRAVRAPDDYAKFYVLDSAFWELLRRQWKYVPDWFKEVVPWNRLPEYEKKRRKKAMEKSRTCSQTSA